MEQISTLLDGERNFFSEEADFMSHLFGNFSNKLPNVSTFQDSSAFWSHEASISVSDNTNANMRFLFQEDSNNSVFFPTSSGETESYISVSCSSGGRKGISVIPSMEYSNNVSTNSMKRSCSEADVNTICKKPRFSDSDKELNKVATLNTNGKKRASSGTATDSQSVYAKKRRERINERLRMLQNLVPNGTKVDISTMLEEAVEYVKFLQLQIKLLSSDDMWMYAPIAYNGMDLGLDVKLPSPT